MQPCKYFFTGNEGLEVARDWFERLPVVGVSIDDVQQPIVSLRILLDLQKGLEAAQYSNRGLFPLQSMAGKS